MKQLLIVRHAESSWKNNIKDFDRPLNESGIEDAELMSNQLLIKEFKPDLIISSGANRALTTSKIISNTLNYLHEKIEINNNIYNSTYDIIIDIVREVPDNCDKLMIAGHNPSFHYLTQILSNELVVKFSPCSMFCVEFNNEKWRNIKKGKKKFMIYPNLYK